MWSTEATIGPGRSVGQRRRRLTHPAVSQAIGGVRAPAKPATVRFYLDADVVGLSHVLAKGHLASSLVAFLTAY